MSSSEARQRRASRARDRDDDDVEEFERDVDTRPIFDVPEGQLLIVACGTLVFLSVIAIFLVLIFSLTGAAAEEPPPPPPLPACFGFIDLPEGLQPRLECSTTVPGFCSAPGQCTTLVQLSDVSTANLLRDLFTCDSSVCVNGDESCTCTGLGAEPTVQICVRETGQIGQTNFQCRDERQCPGIDAFPTLEESQPCQLGLEIPGTCTQAGGICEYRITVARDGAEELRRCVTQACVDNQCTCPDLACQRESFFVACP